MEIKFDKNIENTNLYVKCTYAEVFTEPKYNKGLKIRSYNSKGLINFKKRDKGKTYDSYVDAPGQIIAVATGNVITDDKGKIWIEAIPNFTNRANLGYFPEHAIHFGAKNSNNEDLKKIDNKLIALLLGGAILIEAIN